MDYHDQEWGIAEHDDQKLFGMLQLEGAQAGLSWYTVLVKREGYYKAFDHFDPHKIIRYDEAYLESLMEDKGIIRNRLKIWGVQKSAHAFLKVKEEFGSFDQYIWQFTDHKPIINHWTETKQIPATTKASDAMSKDLKKRGFKFVGSTICYAFMQACGMVDDHLVSCWRRTGG